MASKKGIKTTKISSKPSASAEKLQRSPKSQNSKKRNYRKYYLLAAVLILTFILFSNMTSNDFTNWDDDKYLITNELVKDLSPSGIKNIFTTYVASNYHPLTMMLFAIELKTFGFSASGFHYVSLFLHLINIVLVFYLFQLLGFREKIIIPIALLFAIHPMHVESIAWIAEQKDLLYGLFYLASIISYLLWSKHDKKSKWFILSIVFFVLSLLSKSMAVTLPLILLLIDWYLNRRKSKTIILEKLPFFALSIVFGILAILSQSGGGAMDITADVTIIDRLFLTSYAIVFYLYKLILPLNLSALHYYPDKIDNLLPFYYYLTPLLIIALIYLIYKIKSDKKILLFGSLFFIASISIVLQIIAVGDALVAERYTYLPYLGLFLILSFYYNKAKEDKRASIRKLMPFIYGLSIAYLLFLSIVTYQRTKVWDDGITLFTDVTNKYPTNMQGYIVLANAYAAKNNHQEAIKCFDKAINLDHKYTEAYMNRGMIKMLSGNLLGALEDYNQVIKLSPEYSQAYTNRGILYTKMMDSENALTDFDVALSINPDDIICLIQRSQIYFNQNLKAEAFADLEKAISINPKHATSYSQRGYFYAQSGKYAEAINDLTKAVSLNPNNSDAYVNLGNTRLMMDDYLGAIEEFNKAIETSPNNAAAYSNRGIAKSKLNLQTEACNDWRIAANMGHVKSREFLSTYCQ